jgi:hypothetical protein
MYLFIYLLSLLQLRKLPMNQCDMVISGEYDKMYEEVIRTDVKVVSQHLLESTEEKHKMLRQNCWPLGRI